jgi:hypothetical protein
VKFLRSPKKRKNVYTIAISVHPVDRVPMQRGINRVDFAISAPLTFAAAAAGGQSWLQLVVAQIRDLSNPDSNLNANIAGKREDSNPRVLRIFPKICQILSHLIFSFYFNHFLS